MMKKKISACLFALLALGGTAAVAADLDAARGPVQLSESQMDRVTAGQYSWATGSASALSGIIRSSSRTTAVGAGPLRFTSATNSSFAFGFGTDANAQAESGF